jgi:SAM-dependent methyltransferase
MDQPGLDESVHRHALRSLARINRLSNSDGILWPDVARLGRSLGRPLRLLDVATGAGDVPVGLWQRAQKAGFALDAAGCDLSPTALEHAHGQAAAAGASVRFFRWDALHDPVPGEYDVVTCSLFLHHLDGPEAVILLRRLAATARRLLLINDLERGPLGWALAWAGSRLLTRSPVVHVDGPLSVEGAFTCAEARGLAREAGLGGVTVCRRWPCRFLLRWRRPPVPSLLPGGDHP